MAQWSVSAASERKSAWLSLDADDNEPVRFWSYVIAAVQSVLPEVGEAALSLTRAPGVDLIEDALPLLINELLDTPSDVVLLLDDYHVIHDGAIHAGMEFFVNHLPGSCRLVIASRSEPPLPIARLRARGSLSEIDAEQLNFSESESECLLNDIHRLGLPISTVRELHRRTEGWVAGLYLAVLLLRGREGARDLIDNFSGGERQIVDYLGGEVLNEQPEAVLNFLLSTSVLERFCAPLCDALTGAGDARDHLDHLERSNYFLIPLDRHREWYRYHHLFAEMLRHELQRRAPETSDALHRRAGSWLADADLISEAVPHLVAAGNLDQATDLIATHGAALATGGRGLGQVRTVAEWLDMIPEEYTVADARLCVSRAGVALVLGRHDEILPWLDRAERATRHGLDQDPMLAVRAKVRRATAWQLLGDMPLSNELAGQIAKPLDGGSRDHALAASVLGDTARWMGDDTSAVEFLTLAGRLGAAGDPVSAVAAHGHLALIAAEHHDWETCELSVSSGFELIAESALHEYWVATFAHLAKGKLLAKRGKTAEAQNEMTRALTLGRRGVGTVGLAYVLLTVAEAWRALGDRRGAVTLVREARELSARAPDPGPVLPRMLEKSERSLRLISERLDSGWVATEELTAREAAVLELLPTGLSTREIGLELGVSQNTIKTHTKNLYRKLLVGGRREAVARAREVGLI
jgi:LuxR family maltose regulon positive regulatory protein